MFRVIFDEFVVETDLIEDALELVRKLRSKTTVATKVVMANGKHLNGVGKTSDGIVYDKALLALGGTEEIADASTSEDSVDTLLRAAGYQLIRKGTKDIYGLMLKSPKKVWTVDEIAKRLKRSNQAISHVLCHLEKRSAVKRHNPGQYQIA